MARNPITIEVLETLDAIDRRGSFAKAAEELNKVTSAVSYAVQKLEEQLDIALFQRQGRRSVLTPAGRLILAEGRDILATTVRLANKAKEVATGWEPRIMIGIESHMDYSSFFAALNDFIKQHPGIEIDVCECCTQRWLGGTGSRPSGFDCRLARTRSVTKGLSRRTHQPGRFGAW